MAHSKFIPVLVSLFLGACAANGYQQFYTDLTGGQPPESAGYIYFEGQPKLYRSGDIEKSADMMARKGYIPIGYSSFNGAIQNTKNAVKQASRVGAEIVLVSSKYTNTVSGSIPWMTPTTTTSTTNVHGSTQGTIGTTPYSGTYTGTGQTTTYGTQTTYIPYSVQRYDQIAAYFVKMRHIILGVMYEDMPASLKEEMGTNKGVFVKIVINETPAFFADIFDGDVIVAVNDEAVYSLAGLNALLVSSAGRTVSLEIYRGGAKIVKSVLLNEITSE